MTRLPATRKCAHPGCTAVMHRKSNCYDAGLCKDHGGRRIGRAGPLPVAMPLEQKVRKGVRVVLVPTPAHCTTGGQPYARVSVAAEPPLPPNAWWME